MEVGDEIIPPFDIQVPVSKVGFSNLSCPFYGVEEDTLFVCYLDAHIHDDTEALIAKMHASAHSIVIHTEIISTG